MSLRPFVLTVALIGAWVGSATHAAETEVAKSPTPQSVADELLAADRAFASASATADAAQGIAAQFADDVVMAVAGKGLVHTRADALAALQAQPDIVGASIRWTPVGVGISGDGRHGFTFGTMLLRKADNSEQPLKYLAYWVRAAEGWRVIAYKRKARVTNATIAAIPPLLPQRIIAGTADADQLLALGEKLALAERAFSDEAQHAGLGPAFLKYGAAEAINLGSAAEPGFIIGARAIAQSVSAGQPPSGSTVAWTPDQVVVAGSNDLGLSIGKIRFNQPAADGQEAPAIPFFTIWRRATPESPWRYIAE